MDYEQSPLGTPRISGARPPQLLQLLLPPERTSDMTTMLSRVTEAWTKA